MTYVTSHIKSIAAGLLLASALSACAPSVLPDDPCAAADRPVELSNLLENSLTDSYEACLAIVRDQAAIALEN